MKLHIGNEHNPVSNISSSQLHDLVPIKEQSRESKGEDFNCGICGKTFEAKTDLKKHTGSVHRAKIELVTSVEKLLQPKQT